MPFVHIRTAGVELSSAQVETLQSEATRLMESVMRKKAGLTAVLVETHDTARWSIGGKAVPLAAHLDVKVTAGTNSANEKAEFVRQAHRLLKSAFGLALPLATYVVVDEVSADAWGYGGLTQDARRQGAA
ncbi:tautomerase family protein [Aurantimonas endophytica]|uniref:4-oxalocrotonate tautomerase n=1 Tax=Aurantimonas endophytica TaxID=1522175 RepID=A0A7W6HIH9_9HYPH|nr:tautomerase family protein [Aurantimonas endophytica]MBB4005566.1 4-oxalocrotonate tautomerase [Aurantimonas endophytica]MCO6406463.1 4-oxalocrotonate tautomerase [Aurantimonas endophytica]